MESAKATVNRVLQETGRSKYRKVPESRIKRLEHNMTIAPDTMYMPSEYLLDMFAKTMANEIMDKLLEFNKIVISKTSDGYVKYHSHIDVIVP